MKKVLAFALVGLLAASSVFAGINFSGSFKGGYKAVLTLDDMSKTTLQPNDEKEGTLSVTAKDDDGIWSVTLKNEFSIGNMKADGTATINFDKLAAKLGSDWGNWTLKFTAGNNKDPKIASAYNSKVGGNYSKIAMNAAYPMVLDVSDGNWVNVEVGVDPTYGTFGKDPAYTDKVASFMASAKASPIDGLDLSLGYVFNGKEKFYTIMNPNDPETHSKDATITFAHAIAFEFNVDLAKMIGLDFSLAISGGDNFLINAQKFNKGDLEGVLPTAKDMANLAGVGVYAGIDLISGYAEVIIGTGMQSGGKAGTAIGGKAGLSTSCGLDGFSLTASLETANFAKFVDDFKVSGGASYGFAGTGITAACDLTYEKAGNKLTIKPTMTVKF